MDKCDYHDEVMGIIRSELKEISSKLETMGNVSSQILIEQAKINQKTLLMWKAGIFSIMGAAGAIITMIVKNVL